MASLLRSLLAAVAVLLAVAGNACAAGGRYTFDGGTRAERAQVRAALNASSFNWSLVPSTIRIHIASGHPSEATQGEIWLDADLLDAGELSWGVVQHEYAHQVDFFLLDDAKRTQLAPLGGASWWGPGAVLGNAPDGTLSHGDLTAERFASTLAWSYWQSSANILRPVSSSDEAAAMAPAAFRAALAKLLPAR